MPVFITLLIAKTAMHASRWLGRGGGLALPGLVAEKLDPNLAAKLIKQLSGGVIVVTGTNGKTTTTKMLAEMLAGQRLITNRSGSNLKRGIVASLVEQASLRGKLPATMAIFEVDEASMEAVCRQVKPKLILVLNLFRDQLDRYGELDRTAQLIGAAITISPRAQLVLNADDPLVASLARFATEERGVYYYGVNESGSSRLESDHTADSDHCPLCGGQLIFTKNYFGHIGHYRCTNNDFKRPKPSFFALETGASIEGTDVMLNLDGAPVQIRLPLPGLYNLYNALAAATASCILEVKTSMIVDTLTTTTAAFGRVEKIDIEGKTLYLLLIKNPTGFNQVIQTFLTVKSVQVLVAINDNFADGRDVSWLWDAGVEGIRSQGPILVSGQRRYDMALRLKYAKQPYEIRDTLDKGVDALLEVMTSDQPGFILPSYTAMLAIRNILRKRGAVKEYWK